MNTQVLGMIAGIAPYVAAALGLITTLVLFLGVKREVYKLAQRERKQVESRMEEVAAQVRESAARPELVYVPAPMRPGLNINRRVHASRMLRHGDDVSTIAAALGVPRREVELLVRVQAMASRPQNDEARWA